MLVNTQPKKIKEKNATKREKFGSLLKNGTLNHCFNGLVVELLVERDGGKRIEG